MACAAVARQGYDAGESPANRDGRRRAGNRPTDLELYEKAVEVFYNKHKHELKEQEETTPEETPTGGGGSKENIQHNIVLTPIAVDGDEVVKALNNVDNLLITNGAHGMDLMSAEPDFHVDALSNSPV